MPRVAVSGIELEYERTGDPAAPTLLMIMGLGAQLCAWDDEFVDRFVQRGFCVVRMDNRDIGLSSKWPTGDAQEIAPLLMAAMQGQPVVPPYTLADMADDAAGLLRALAIPRAHVVGVSMGGMIAQVLALRCPKQVASLTSIMSTTNERGLPPPEPRAIGALLSPIPSERSANIARIVEAFRVIGSPPPLFDEDRVRARAARAYDRSFYRAGFMRQMLAVATAPGRTAALGSLAVPALVIHGEQDPLIPVACGRATAAAIPGSRLLVLPGMGHDLPTALWPELVEAICSHAEAAEAPEAPESADRRPVASR
jgi:pimeloyl-ACP methyl ester carboxylesterase